MRFILNNKLFEFKIIVVILILTSILRLFRLSEIPEGFHGDEAAFGYNAYSILATGKDEYGVSFPLFLRSFDDYKGALYSYIAIPFVKIFGLTEFAVRLPTALFGIFLSYITFLLVKKITKNQNLSLLSAVLYAVSPWSLLLSRVQSDPLVAVSLVLVGLYFFLLWTAYGRILYYFLFNIFWILSYFTYPSPRIFLPAFFALIAIFFWRDIKKTNGALFILSAIAMICLSIALFISASGSRFSQLTLVNSPHIILPLEEKIRRDGDLPILITRLFHNKVVDYGNFLLNNSFRYVNYDFLFSKGGQPERERIPDSGLLYIIELPLLLLGVYQIIRQRARWGFFVISWIGMTIGILSLATDETPNVHRFFLAAIPFYLLIAFGIIEFIKFSNRLKYLSIATMFIIYGGSTLFYLHQMFVHQPVYEPYHRGFAYKQLVETLEQVKSKYKKIVVTKAHASPYIYFLFYTKYDPKKYQTLGSPRDYEGSHIDNYYFTSKDCPLSDRSNETEGSLKQTGILYVNKGSCERDMNSKHIATIHWGNGASAFELVEYVKEKE